MLPANWASSVDRPRRFDIATEREQLRSRYQAFGASPQIDNLLDALGQHGATHALVEAPYVDWDYRAEYSQLYSREFNPPSDKAERLLFFADDTFLGFAVMRPTPKPVGRTALAPPPGIRSATACLARHHVRPAGDRHCVEAYPFLSQDGQYGRCAHAAVWSIARYHHLRYGTAKHSIAAVVEAAGTRETIDRTFASGGLHLHEVAAAFRKLGLPALMYDPLKLPNIDSQQETLESVACRYLDSGFPVALNTHAHLTVLIGYGYAGDELVFVRSDDNKGPYELLHEWRGDEDRLGSWEMLMVPLPGRIHVPSEHAETAARRELDRISGARDTLWFRQRLKNGELRLRTYAIDSPEYKCALPKRAPALPEEIIVHHQSVPLASWIWVTEFQDASVPLGATAKVLAEVVIDATSHRLNPRPLLANLPDACYAWLPGEREARRKPLTPQVERFGSALPRRHVSPPSVQRETDSRTS
jgi:hypothetical protein